MKILLDTCTFLWIVAGSNQLSQEASEAFQDPENQVFLSPVSAWELSLKFSLGKLPLPKPPSHFVPEQREKHLISPLVLNEDSVLMLANLPQIHRDPFDRMLICQALFEGMTLLSPDADIVRYPVRTLW